MGKKTEAPELWERQKGEPSTAFDAFRAYRDSGIGGAKRSIQKTALSLTKKDGTLYSYATLKVWSHKYKWRTRVDAYDADMDRQTQDELRKGRVAMLKNHVGIAQAMIRKALQALQRIPAEELTAQDIARIVDTAAKLERISRGEATERTESKQTITGEVRAEVDLSVLTNGELDQLGELVRKLAAD